MSGLRRALGLVAIEGVVVGLVALAIVLSSDHIEARAFQGVLGLFIGWSWIGAGLIAWWRRPDNRFGVLMTAVGFAFFLSSLAAADAAWLFTVGVLLSSVYFAVFVHMLVSYPDGRIGSDRLRKVVAAGYVISVLGPLPSLLFATPERLDCDNCPQSVLFIEDNGTLYTILDVLTSLLAVVLVGYVVFVTLARFRDAPQARRRAMAPVIWSGAGLLVRAGGRAADRGGRTGREAITRRDRAARARAVRARALRLRLRRAALARPPGGRGDRVPAPDRRRPGPERPPRPALDGPRRPLAAGRLLARPPAPVGRRRRPSRRAARRRRPRARRDPRRARGPRGRRADPRPLAVRGPGARRLRRRRRRPLDRERAPAGPAARAGRGAARVARPDRRRGDRRAPAARAQPARRRPAAARRALAHAAGRPGPAAQATPTGRRR